jgi:UDP-N-acetylglucosamine 2-epimerase (non-hydrolysing)
VTGERLQVLVVIGTRPEAIKLGPVVRELAGRSEVQVTVVVTGQHREMVDPMLDAFGIEPAVDLELLEPGQSLTRVTVRALEGLAGVLDRRSADAVVVQGDTTTAFAGALAGFYARVPAVHVEAGLRTGDLANPYPEEANRRLITQVTSLHLAPTAGAANNLIAAGVAHDSIVITGNTVIDALRWAVAEREEASDRDPAIAALDGDARRLVLFTVHRRESWAEGLAKVATAMARIAEDEDVVVVIPIHRNPIVRDALLPPLEGLRNVVVVEPLPYVAFARLMARARVIVTDSGGIQEEAPSLGVPVLVLRDVTERPEAVAAGVVRVIGTDPVTIATEVRRLVHDDDAHREMARVTNPYGDGKGASRCADAILWYLGRGDRPEDFTPSAG